MFRPPLANLFAVHNPQPAELDAIMRDLQRSGEFAEVWRPAPGWVAGSAPLPRGQPDGEPARQHQLVFAEGRDVLERYLHGNLGRVAELVDQHPERLASLPGDFGFIHFRTGGEATVVRSCGGLVPLYVKRARSGWAIATRLGDLVRYLPDEPRLDPLVNAIWTTGWGMFPDGRTFLEGVTIVARGHFARLNDQLEVQCYWDPRPPRVVYPTRRRAREHAQRLRALLVAKLERDLDPEDGNLLTLSGGVDSTALAALAVGVVGRKVWSWSLLPSKENAHWHSREMSFIEPLAQQYGVRRRWEVHYHERLLLELWPAAPRIVFHVLHPALCSLSAIVREAPVRVMFGGECADEVCGSAFTVPDWTRDTSLLHLLMDPEISLKNPRVLVRWARGRFDLLRGRAQPPFPRRLLELDMFREHPLLFFHPAVRAEYAAYWDRKSRELREETRPWRYVAMHLDMHDAFVPMNWEACSALGIRRSLPFFNREALELMYECHPTELYGPKIKKLLRMALHGDVPARNLYREDKGVWGAGERKVQKSVQEAMPYESLPEDLEPLLSPDWCRNPPRMLNYSELRYLARLMLFIDSVRARRHERKISADNDRRLSREEAV